MVSFPDQIQVLLPMKKLRLANLLFAYRYYQIFFILAYCRIVVIIRTLLGVASSKWIVFEFYFIILKQSIALILLRVSANLSHKFLT